jgi:glutamate synthase (NADPH/NADH) small chain
MEKRILDRRLELLEAEGIVFKTNANVGVNVKVEDLQRDFDAIVLCGGATKPRDLPVPGRELSGIHFAMEYLPQQNKRNLGDAVDNQISAKDKHVIILGGGDTGADCLGTAHRQGARSIRQFELLPKPPEGRTADMPWPYWPMIYRTSSAHEEGGERDFAINTKKFSGENGVVKKLHGIRLEWEMAGSRPAKMKEVPDSDFELDCDLCLLALGFLGPQKTGMIEQLGLELDPRGNVKVDSNYMSSTPGIFAAGDMRRGQSLVVWAISEGRCAAHGVDQFLMGKSDLPYLKLF